MTLATDPLLAPLPADRPRVERVARIPAGFLGMLALIVSIEAYLGARPLEFNTSVSLSWVYSARAIPREAPGRDVLFFGDSLIKFGLIPQVFEKHSGLSAHNFAGARAVAPTTYFLFRRALESGSRPAAVIVDFKPVLLGCNVEYALRDEQAVLSWREANELAATNRSAIGGGVLFSPAFRQDSLWIRIVLGRALASYRARFEVRAWLRAIVTGEPDPNVETNRALVRNWNVNGGAHVQPENPAFDGVARAHDVFTTGAQMTLLAPVNAAFVEKFFALAAKRGIRVYWLLPPSSPQFQARREQTGAEATFLAAVRKVHKRFPNVTVLDARHSGFDHTLFCDLAHLSGRGARALSRSTAEAIQDNMNDPLRSARRWIDLPLRRADDEVVEDLDQSRAMVRSEGAAEDHS